MKLQTAAIFILLAGCATVQNLTPPTRGEYFTLEKNIYDSGTYGFMNIKRTVVLVPCTYDLIGENTQGFYYVCSKPSVGLLADNDLQNYDLNKSLPEKILRMGGLVLPKQDSELKPSVFYIVGNEISSTPNSIKTVATSNAGGDTVVAGATSGLTMSVISAMTNGAFDYYPITDDFLSNIKVKSK